MSKKMIAAVVLGLMSGVMAAEASTVVGSVSVTATNSFPDAEFGTPENLINQGGLANGYVSGVTDFDAYIASNPRHTPISTGAEWFTDFFVSSASLTFDLGSVITIGRVAAWVDEFWGVGTIAVYLSLDNSSFVNVGSFNPTDWPTVLDNYGADVFSFDATATRFVRLDLSNCPQPLSAPSGGCGMGEVAFATAAVPEPGTLALLGLGLAGLGLSRRRKAA